MTSNLGRLAVCSVLLVLASGCSAPRIDGTSAAGFEASFDAVRGPLSERERTAFDAAIQEIALEGLSMEDLLVHGTYPTARELAFRARDKLDGRTAKAILAEGRRLRAARGVVD